MIMDSEVFLLLTECSSIWPIIFSQRIPATVYLLALVSTMRFEFKQKINCICFTLLSLRNGQKRRHSGLRD